MHTQENSAVKNVSCTLRPFFGAEDECCGT